MDRRDIMVIGASAGGVEALQVLAESLPADFPGSLFVVIHVSPFSPHMLPQILSRRGPLLAVQTQDRMAIQHGRIYIAPPDHHLILSSTHVHVVRGPRENLVRPAVDPLFRSAARVFGRRVVGVVLTGNLDDGSAGLVAIKERGGLAVVQDPDEARYPSMPLSALRYVQADYRVRLAELGPLLIRLSREELGSLSAEAPVPAQLEAESTLMEPKSPNGVAIMERIGTLAPYSCPECYGPMWRMHGNGPPRFRCHVGHGFTAESLQAGQVASRETGLWQLLRTLEEQFALAREISDQARKENQARDAARWNLVISGIEDDIRVLQGMLVSEKPSVEASPPA